MKKKNQHKNKGQGSKVKGQVTHPSVLSSQPSDKDKATLSSALRPLPSDAIGRKIYEYVMQLD